MATATMTAERPAPAQQDAEEQMSALEAFKLRDSLRAADWEPVETSTDFRKAAVGPEHEGAERTIAYFPAFKSKLGGAMGWSKPGRPDTPDEAAFVEVYRVKVSGPTARWVPAD